MLLYAATIISDKIRCDVIFVPRGSQEDPLTAEEFPSREAKVHEVRDPRKLGRVWV